MLKTSFAFLLTSFIILNGCTSNTRTTPISPTPKIDVEKIEKKVGISYQLLYPKDSVKNYLKLLNEQDIALVANVNRADKAFLKNFDSIIVPVDKNQKILQYFPFPFYATFLKDVEKIIFFSYPAQSFAAYQNGVLVYTGPTSMGRKADLTPTGLFFTNWKAEETTSTFNDEWQLKWNFNIENKLGVGFHQYEMPGYPASHSCLRLTEKDAKYLYEWADQWTIKGTDDIIAHGTPVVVFGSYPFGSSKPWLALAKNPNALTISETDLEKTASSYLPDIMQKQAERDSVK